MIIIIIKVKSAAGSNGGKKRPRAVQDDDLSTPRTKSLAVVDQKVLSTMPDVAYVIVLTQINLSLLCSCHQTRNLGMLCEERGISLLLEMLRTRISTQRRI